VSSHFSTSQHHGVITCVSLGVLDIFRGYFSLFLIFFSLLCQEFGWDEYLRNDLFCVECDVKC